MAAFLEVTMEIIYQGKNITDRVIVSSAKCRDVSHGRYDSVDLLLEQAAAWHSWEPQVNDTITLTNGGYSTGEMYVHTIAPEDGKFRILATAAKAEAGRKARRSFEEKTLEDIIRICAAECGMEYRLFGVDGKTRFHYLLRGDEGCAAFLARLAELEGAVLKTYSGRFTMIGIAAAQKMNPIETMKIDADQGGILYRSRKGRLHTLTVKTPFAVVTATDSAEPQGSSRTECGLPASDVVTAGRWARGLLLKHNRRADMLTVETTFRPGWSAMVRLDVTGNTEANGEWIIDEVVHDLIAETSRAVMLRCIESVN